MLKPEILMYCRDCKGERNYVLVREHGRVFYVCVACGHVIEITSLLGALDRRAQLN